MFWFYTLFHLFHRTNGFRPLLDNNAPRATPPIFLPSHLASLGTQFHPPLFPHLKGKHVCLSIILHLHMHRKNQPARRSIVNLIQLLLLDFFCNYLFIRGCFVMHHRFIEFRNDQSFIECDNFMTVIQ